MNNFLKIFTGAFSFVYYYRSSLLKALSVPFVLLFLLSISGYIFDLTSAWVIVLAIIYNLILVIFAITIHRIILLGEASVPEWGFRKISMREVRFIMYSIGMGLLVMVPGLLVFVPIVGWMLALVSIAYLLGRLSLVFPAIATGQNWSFYDSWVATKDHQLLMAVTAAILPLIIALPETILAYIPYGEIPAVILSLFTTVFAVAALSLAFRLVLDEIKLVRSS